ncbi:hypothetical protein PYW07_012857 [Mythimna separata]|uniref:ZAD domain-containing protein n=1 Tax=Mythimna separata TaxID=271217 RepID=A0AAD7Y9C7_MYTSE|nr:hypothetical protein PYW07_012857 [Mythimna separata]
MADMTTTTSSHNFESACAGCLSHHLAAIVTDVEIKKAYYELLNITVENLETVTLRLCLECRGNILKFDAFKRQVIDSHDVLNKYLVRESLYLERYRNPLYDFDIFLLLSPDIDRDY